MSYSIGWEAGEQPCSSGNHSAAFLVLAQDIPQREPEVGSIDENSLSQGIRDSPMAVQVSIRSGIQWCDPN